MPFIPLYIRLGLFYLSWKEQRMFDQRVKGRCVLWSSWSYAGWIAPSCFRCVLAVAAWNQIIVGAEAAGFAWNFQPHLPCLVAVTDDPQGCLWIWKSLWGCSRTKRQWRANNNVCSQWLRYCSCCSNLQHAVYTCSVWIYGLDRLMYRGAIGVSGWELMQHKNGIVCGNAKLSLSCDNHVT